VKQNYTQAINWLLAHESGYSNHPSDNGGATNWGITHITLGRWRKKPVTARDVFELSVDEAKQIYKAWFWDELNCDGLPSGMDYAVFDFGVNAGPKRSAKLLQRLLRTTADGEIGPNTLKLAAKANRADLISRFTAQRLEYHMGLADWPVFGKGWKRRILDVNAKALSMG
jgi:lysozyme family protein